MSSNHSLSHPFIHPLHHYKKCNYLLAFYTQLTSMVTSRWLRTVNSSGVPFPLHFIHVINSGDPRTTLITRYDNPILDNTKIQSLVVLVWTVSQEQMTAGFLGNHHSEKTFTDAVNCRVYFHSSSACGQLFIYIPSQFHVPEVNIISKNNKIRWHKY